MGKAVLPRERVRLRWALWLKERTVGRVNNVWKREGECQVDIVDGDNAAEIAGGQRGLMMMLLASERASERANRASCSWTGTPLYSPLHPLPPIRRTPRLHRSFATSSLPRFPHYPSFSNSGIPISRAASCRCPCCGICSRISHSIVH